MTMNKLVAKIYVDCEERYYSIYESNVLDNPVDNFDTISYHISELTGVDEEALKTFARELNVSPEYFRKLPLSDDDRALKRLAMGLKVCPEQNDLLWDAVAAHLRNGNSCFLVAAHHDYVLGIHTTLESAREHAEKLAEESLAELLALDKSYAAIWSQIAQLKSALLHLAEPVEQAMASLASADKSCLLSADIHLDEELYADLQRIRIGLEEDIYPVLQCIRRFQGKECEASAYGVDIDKADPHVPYALPVRTRFKQT